MRVLINALPAMRHKTGVGHYVAELVRSLQTLLPGGVEAYPPRRDVLMLRWWERQAVRYEALARTPGLTARLRMHARGKFLALLRKTIVRAHPDRHHDRRTFRNCDLYHEPNLVPFECDAPTVVTVADLSALLRPEWHRPEWADRVQRSFPPSLNRCRHLFALSRFGKDQIVKHLGWPADRVTVTPPGVRPGLRRLVGPELDERLAGLGLRDGYLLHVGTIEPRKNLPMLLRAYGALPDGLRRHVPLVLVGAGGWKSEEVHDLLRGEARRQNVRWLNYQPDKHFSALYSGARALLVPSLLEGFGTTAVEMMAVGGAVIASTAGALPETTAGQAHLIDPHDEAGWRDAMLRVCRDRDWRHSLCQGGQQVAARYTWERCAELTLGAYRRVLAGGRIVQKGAVHARAA